MLPFQNMNCQIIDEGGYVIMSKDEKEVGIAIIFL